MLRWRCALLAAAALAAVALSACAIVDQFSPRAVEFNLQAERAQQSNLLLNIIRASLRRPMQFTGLSSITGTASASGSLTGGYTHAQNWPLIRDFGLIPPASSSAIAGAITRSSGATASMSGGPTFTVPVLDTQEFYQGILGPLSPQVVDYYVKQGYHPQILFSLFVGRVEVIATKSPRCERFTFINDVRDEVQFAQFQALSDYLISSGFTTERISDRRQFGPPITMSQRPVGPADAALLLQAYSRAAEAGLELPRAGPDATRARPDAARPDQPRPPPVTTLAPQKRTTRFRFCFARDIHQEPRWLDDLEPAAFCGQASLRRHAQDRRQKSKVPSRTQTNVEQCGIVRGSEPGAEEGGTAQFFDIKLHPMLLERFARIQRAHRDTYHSPENFFPIDKFRGKDVTFRFYGRSVESILYFLGEVTRQHLRPEDGKPRIIQVKVHLRYGTLPYSECDSVQNGGRRETKSDLYYLTTRKRDTRRTYNCDNLFVLDTGLEPNAFYSVTYDGVTYFVPPDPERAGRTTQVLELVKQLLALHTSARTLPQAGVFSLIGGGAQ
jgi:hypothetical protein